MKAIISGAGIAGLAAAYELGRAGWDVVVLEKADSLRDGGYMIDFFGPGYDAAEANGLLDAFARHARKVEGVELVNADGSRQGYMSYRSFAAPLGGRLFSLMRGDLERVLFNALGPNVDLRFGTRIETVDNGPASVDIVTSAGDRLQGDVLIGADGIHSPLRAHLFTPEPRVLRYLGYHTAAYIFRSDAVAKAVQDRFLMLSLPDRQAGLYRMEGDSVAVYFIWRDTRPERADDAGAAIRENFGDLGWLVPETLAAMPPNAEIYYDVVAQIEADQWCNGRVALLGDAAFAVSLLAGQGASLAMGGAHILAQQLASQADVPTALARYDTILRPEVVKKQAAGRKAADWIVPHSPFRVWLRARVFNLSSLPFVSRVFERLVATSPKGVFTKKRS